MSLRLHEEDIRLALRLLRKKAEDQGVPERFLTFLRGLERAEEEELRAVVNALMIVSATLMKAERELEEQQEDAAVVRHSSRADWN